MTDLTERLAAKLTEAGVPSEASVRETVRVFYAASGDTTIPEVRDEMMRAQIASDAGTLLPLLLSEPELVAGLAPEVKDDLLNQMVSAKYRDAVAREDKLAAMTWLNALNYTAEVMP